MMKFEIGTQESKKWKGEKIMTFNNGAWKYKKVEGMVFQHRFN